MRINPARRLCRAPRGHFVRIGRCTPPRAGANTLLCDLDRKDQPSMSTATAPSQHAVGRKDSPGAAGAADVLVVFGITGDLAKVMTFRSLYRLELRGLLDCPIVGVAGDDWTIAHLRKHARESIAATGERVDAAIFERFAERLSYVEGDFADAATYERV